MNKAPAILRRLVPVGEGPAPVANFRCYTSSGAVPTANLRQNENKFPNLIAPSDYKPLRIPV
uniref:Uncharacterized protein n=1 Tax=Romanomermis culicivorax TaxID=13658 RepID=A0A915HQH6_ROMCU